MEARLIDTNVFIDIFRGNELFHRQLQLVRGHINACPDCSASGIDLH